MKKANHTNEEMNCKQCLHYNGCLKRFRNAKENGIHESMNEEEYFSHANECDFYISDCKDQDDWISANNPPEDCGMPVLMVAVNKYGQRKTVKGFTSYTCPIKFLTNEKEYASNWQSAWKVTHWMPLPEPPKAKGGAE